jgi:hypothetical protein
MGFSGGLMVSNGISWDLANNNSIRWDLDNNNGYLMGFNGLIICF